MASRILVAVALIVLASGSVTGSQVVHAQSIDRSALFFDSHNSLYRSPIGAVKAGTPVTIRFRTTHNGATSVSVEWMQLSQTGWVSPVELPMSLDSAHSTAQYDLWQAVLTPPAAGISGYGFLVRDGSAQVGYEQDPKLGFGTAGIPTDSPPTTWSAYPLIAYQPSFTVPSWLKGAVMYQIFPDRFSNGDTSNDSKVMSPAYGVKATVIKNWNAAEPITPDYNQLNYYGGDLRGIIDKLPYLKGLGINVIYLNPIFEAGTNHGYDTVDYMKIAAHLGTLKTFKALVAAAHKDGIKIILDGVFNHTSSDSIYFDKDGYFSTPGAYESQSSPYYGWYTFQQWPQKYSMYYTVDTLPELNESDAVKSFIYRAPNSVAQYWLAQGADGWRLDHTIGKSEAWWQEFRTILKSRFPKDAIICECDWSINNALPDLLRGLFDGDMNYTFQAMALGFFAQGQGSFTATQFLDGLTEVSTQIPRPAMYGSMNVIGTHDTDRALDMVHDSFDEMKQLAALQMTSLGMPEIYYGDEAGLTGSGSPDTIKRKPFPWSHPNKDLQSFYRTVIHLRLKNPALQDGAIIPLLANDAQRVVAFLRQDAKQTIPVVINDGAGTQNVSIPTTGIKRGAKLVDGISGKTYKVTGSHLTVRVDPISTAILVPAP